MNLHIVRHTKLNVPPGVCYGETDVEVRASFQEEAGIVKSKLDGIRFTHCFSSPLTRCRVLAENIISYSLTIQYDDRLKELNFGQWEGKKWENLIHTLKAKQWFDDYLNNACPAGESYAILIERIRSFVDDLKQLPGNSEVLIVTHGGPIRCFLVILKGIAPEHIFDIIIDYGEVKNIKLETSVFYEKLNGIA